MNPDQAAQIIQKAWFEYKSWCVAQNAEYLETPVYWTNTYSCNYEDETVEYLF
jgi:hypothetical protein